MMKTFKKILLIHPCDKAALERAAVLCKEHNAELTLLHVIPEPHQMEVRTLPGGQRVDILALIVQRIQRELEEVASSLIQHGLHIQAKVLKGDESTEIVREVIRGEYDLAITIADKPENILERFFGTTTSRLIRKCPIPLLVLKPGQQKFTRVLASIDPILVGDSHDTLNSTILELSMSLANEKGDELHIAHAWSIYGEAMMRGMVQVPKNLIEAEIEHERLRRQQLMRLVIAKSYVGPHVLHLPKGDASVEIPKLIDALKIDVLVMGTVCRTGIPGFLIGNTAESILARVHCSVLVVKPLGFVSPIVPE